MIDSVVAIMLALAGGLSAGFLMGRMFERIQWSRSAKIAFHNTSPEFSWATGLFEGEGTFFVDKRKEYNYFRMSIKMTDEDVMKRFAAVVGVGHVRGPYLVNASKPSQRLNVPLQGFKPYWSWQLSGPEAKSLAERMWPLLSDRRRSKIMEISVLTDRREIEWERRFRKFRSKRLDKGG